MSSDTKKRLVEIVAQLPTAQAETLLEFAEFLLGRHSPVSEPLETTPAEKIPSPLDIPRPAQESVVKAVKRLRATYPMLDARKLLHQTSELMTQHVVQGREAEEVIEELEILFRSHYEELK